ncbi:MAG: hypothetical protein ACE5FM_02305 [Methyloligellaceae bacterium]
MSTPRTWAELKDRLEAHRAALNEEIAAYPPPIPACDAQFNHLLEQRSGINRELKRLEDMEQACCETGGDADALRQFVKSCEFFLPRSDGDKNT